VRALSPCRLCRAHGNRRRLSRGAASFAHRPFLEPLPFDQASATGPLGYVHPAPYFGVPVNQTVEADGGEGAGLKPFRVEVGMRGVEDHEAAVILEVQNPTRFGAGFETGRRGGEGAIVRRADAQGAAHGRAARTRPHARQLEGRSEATRPFLDQHNADTYVDWDIDQLAETLRGMLDQKAER
jgi:hypothetical protein